MFSEYKELMTRLKATDPHFAELCAKHDVLDQQIHNIEAHTEVVARTFRVRTTN